MAKMIQAAGHELILYGSAGSNAPCDEFVEIVSWDTMCNQYRPDDKSAVKWNWEQREDSPEWTEHRTRGRLELQRRVRTGDIALISFGYFQRFVAETAYLPAEFICGYSGVFSEHKVFPSYAWMQYLYGVLGAETHPNWMDAVIPHYLDTGDFPFVPEKQDYLLFLGRLNPVKGPDIAIDVAREAGIKLVIAGQAEDGNREPDFLKSKAKDSDVEFVGAVDHGQRLELFKNARALIAPARWLEAFGMTSIEALACGTPVISSDWGSFPEIVQNGVNGFRCRDMEEFVEAVDKVKDVAPARCRQIVEERYSLSAAWEEYARYFRRLAKLHNPKGWYAMPKDMRVVSGDGGVAQRGMAILDHLSQSTVAARQVHGAEVGVLMGELSESLLRAMPNLHLTMVDRWKEFASDSSYVQSGDAEATRSADDWGSAYRSAKARTRFAGERARFVQGDSLEVAEGLNNEMFDFVFVDADHSYSTVSADVRAWWPKVKPGGVLCGHDWCNPAGPQWGVKRAVSEFANSVGIPVSLDADYTWFIEKPVADRHPSKTPRPPLVAVG